MINAIKKGFASLAVRIFVGFWLITIISIFSTRWISEQLIEPFVTVPVQDKEINILTRYYDRLAQFSNSAQSIDQFINRVNRSKKHSFILLKNTQTNHLAMPKNLRIQKQIVDHLSNNIFSEPQSIHSKSFHIIGPRPFTLNSQTYQIFLAKKIPQRIQPGFIKGLPSWSRLVIPLTISAILCWLLSWSITRQLRALSQTTQRLGQGQLNARVESGLTSQSEIGELARSVNYMASRLEQSVTAQQRLLADISHELRSPLTRMQIALALAQRVEHQSSELDKHHQRCELELSRLDEMISDVLQVSRLENSLQTINKSNINFSQLITHIINDADIIAKQKTIELVQQVTENIVLHGDEQLLASAVENIVNNAIKYGPENSSVTVRLKTCNKSAVLSVTDCGNGVPDSAILSIFEPFYRVNESRDRKTGGTGLGLAIAKRAITAHGGTVSAKNQAPGFVITLNLPLS